MSSGRSNRAPLDPWNFFGEPCPKPIVVAVHGTCNTLGIELALASQAAVAAEGTRFAQLEVARGIFPLGGGTFRLPARPGAAGIRYLLTAERFDADAAVKAGLVNEVLPEGQHLERAVEIARLIAANARSRCKPRWRPRAPPSAPLATPQRRCCSTTVC